MPLETGGVIAETVGLAIQQFNIIASWTPCVRNGSYLASEQKMEKVRIL